MKSDLQIRAEKAAERFGSARKPIVLEFAGVPKAGKTTTLNALQAFLKRCGFRVEIVVERASVCPILDKKHANFNVWTACTTLAHILEKTQNPPRPEDPHVLILDRGLFDSICWLTLMERLERIRPQDRELIERFLRLDDWRKRISAVFVMIVSPTDALTREKGLLPVEGGKGSIMNQDVLNQMLNTTKEAAERMKSDFRIFNIDTSSGQLKNGAKKTAEVVADLALNVIEEHLREDIFSLPKAEVTKLFGAKRCLSIAEARALVAAFNMTGNFAPREQVETDKTRVQALPVVVIRNKSGDVLRLRRKERLEDSPLHEKLVVWAGGHVRKEDQINGDCLIQCALREVQEELRLSINAQELSLQGAIYSELGERSAQHVAIVYEWKAATDEVAVVLSSAEFFERRGTSLSGSFVPLKDLALDVDKEEERERRVTEEWSVEIVREILAKDAYRFSPRLL
jgi:predicted NUDIX family phosphoesterase